MLGGILVIVVTGIVSFLLIDQLKSTYPFIDATFLKRMFFYHILLSFAYYFYGITSGSDSLYYYTKVITDYRGPTWFDFYGTSTPFIEFVGYPFIRFFGFSYEAITFLFSFFGFVGFVYFYIFFREHVRFKHQFLGVDLMTLIFFLPNLHFWSASFGKGSIILMGIALYFFGISNLRRRWLAIAIGGMIIYHVRPHIMLVMLVSSAIGFMFSSRGVSVWLKALFLAASSVAFFFIYQDVLALVGIDEDQFLTQGLDLSHRASELSKATSGLDITQYSLPLQVFTFLYRPLFFDAPGALGLIVSFENVFYLLITLQLLFNMRGLRFLFTGSMLIKSAFLSFITVSIALAQISGNLGLAMRQKSQIMILLLFVIISFLDEEKMNAWNREQRRRARMSPQLR
jgi:hypothetical protein